MHVVALTAASVSVMLPAAQSAHATVETAEYLPASHVVHVVALTAASVLVMLPAAQIAHVTVETAE